MLEVRGLRAGYGTREIVHGVDMTIPTGAIVTLLGHNGAGKSTMLGSLIGKVTHMGGTVRFDGHDISQTTIANAVRLGIVLVPEKGRLFRNFTVEKNLRLGGYTVKDGVLIPAFDHSTVIEAVFRRTRVTVGVMTAAKLHSAVEPVIRYQRSRFRGAEQAAPGSVRYELGIQQREDALHRLVDVWATGEAAASLGFATARLFDALDPQIGRASCRERVYSNV